MPFFLPACWIKDLMSGTEDDIQAVGMTRGVSSTEPAIQILDGLLLDLFYVREKNPILLIFPPYIEPKLNPT